jgi:hypothetical protein
MKRRSSSVQIKPLQLSGLFKTISFDQREQKLGSDLGPLSAKYRTKPCSVMQDRATRIISIAFSCWSSKQRVGESNRTRKAETLQQSPD